MGSGGVLAASRPSPAPGSPTGLVPCRLCCPEPSWSPTGRGPLGQCIPRAISPGSGGWQGLRHWRPRSGLRWEPSRRPRAGFPPSRRHEAALPFPSPSGMREMGASSARTPPRGPGAPRPPRGFRPQPCQGPSLIGGRGLQQGSALACPAPETGVKGRGWGWRARLGQPGCCRGEGGDGARPLSWPPAPSGAAGSAGARVMPSGRARGAGSGMATRGKSQPRCRGDADNWGLFLTPSLLSCPGTGGGGARAGDGATFLPRLRCPSPQGLNFYPSFRPTFNPQLLANNALAKLGKMSPLPMSGAGFPPGS